MTRIQSIPLSLPVVVFAILVAFPFAHASTQQGPECAMLELRIVSIDSVRVIVPRASCPVGRLVLAGVPRRLTERDGYWSHHAYEIPVAIENTGAADVRVPVGMKGDSITAVRFGRQLSSDYSRPYHSMLFWPGLTDRPWAFGVPDGRLLPGERSAPQSLHIVAQPVAETLRLWFDVERLSARATYPLFTSPRPRAIDSAPLPRAVTRFIAGSRLPKVRASRALFRLSQHDLVMFQAWYGEPMDCPSGCFYWSLIGLKYKEVVGWLRTAEMDARARDELQVERDTFPSAALDRDVLSHGLLDTLYRVAGRGDANLMRDVMLRHPDVPRPVLVRQVEGLYGNPDARLGRLLVELPQVRDDVELLTLLAYLPYDGGRDAALLRLSTLASRLVSDPSTPARTLFAIAPGSVYSTDTSLARRIADHPNGRGNVAILAVVSERDATLRARLIATVRASPSVRAALAAYLNSRESVGISERGVRLLADPEAGANEDVLVVLANSGPSEDVKWAASRRLPEEALRKWDFTYRPIR